MKYLAVIPLLFSSSAIAQEMWLNVHVGSVHGESEVYARDGTRYEINNFNPGIGIEFPVEDNSAGKTLSYRFGAFKNSFSQLSAYGAIDVHSEYTNGFGTGMSIGLISGYKDTPRDTEFVPGVVPRVFYIYNGYRGEVSFLYGANASALSLTFGTAF